jgi:lipopolysaccharide export system permease protein
VLPIGAFIAVLFVFNRLITESELVVMRAAGLSPMSIAKPVLELAGIAFVLLMVLSIYLLPASNREFKDLQFEIRNRFVSSLLQEGAFTTISEKLTIYIGSRNDRGEVIGLLIDDERNPQQPVTILAERGAFADTGDATRIIMVNGNRQQYDRATGKLSVLTFDRYVLDLDMLRDAPEGRFREPQERFLGDLLFPPEDIDAGTRHAYLVEANERLTVPLSALSFAIIPLACLLPGEFNRRGQLRRVLVAIVCALSFQALDLAVKNLEGRYSAAIVLSYVVVLLPLAAGVGILLRRGIRFNFRRMAAAEATR